MCGNDEEGRSPLLKLPMVDGLISEVVNHIVRRAMMSANVPCLPHSLPLVQRLLPMQRARRFTSFYIRQTSQLTGHY